MKILLSITNAEYKSPKQDGITKSVLYIVDQTKRMFPLLSYWGTLGKKRKRIDSDFDKVIFKIKPGIYVLSDTEEGDTAISLQVSLRKEVISIQLLCNFEERELVEKCKILTQYFIILYKDLQTILEFQLVSTISLPEVDYPKPRSPKRWRVFDPWGIVDFISPSKIDFKDAEKITYKLCRGPLPKGVTREDVEPDIEIINWTNFGGGKDNIETILSKRSIWYNENSEFEKDSSFNDLGDMEVYIFENKKTHEFTFYDEFTKTGYKAIGFDPFSKTYEINKLKELQQVLESQKSSDGLLVLKVYIIVSAREFALALDSAVRQYKLNGVLYADDDGQLWNPFPDGLWLN